MTFKTDDRVFETSITTGTGTYTLDGAQVGFTTFSGMGANNLCPYFATDDTNWEIGIGTVLTGPNRLERTTVLRSSNADAAVNWGAGTRKIRCGLPAAMAVPRTLSKSVAGAADVTLTQDEQRRDILILTGALTGNINVIVDATPWKWTVYNNTTGAYTVTLKTTAGTGISVQQGKLTPLHCDGTNVVRSITGLGGLAIDGDLTISGRITAPAQPAFLAFNTTSPANVTGAGATYTVPFDTEVFDQASSFASNTFTAPLAGKYQFSAQVRFSGETAAMTGWQINLVTSNRTYSSSESITPSGAGGGMMVKFNGLVDMDAGDTAYVTVRAVNGAGDTVDILGNASILHTFFSGFLAC